MKQVRMLPLIALVVLMTIVIVGCDSSDETVTDEINPLQMPSDFTGEITEINFIGNDGVLGTIMVEASAGQYIDKYVVTIKDETLLLTQNEKELLFKEIEIGRHAEIWFDGPVKESFPMQVDAAQVMIVGQLETDEASLGQEFQLIIGQKVVFADVDLGIGFVSVEGDSRCPQDATCIWQGEVDVKVELIKGGDSHAMILTQPGLDYEFSKEIYGGYEILFKVIPYPVMDEQIADEEYSLVLIVTQASGEEMGTLNGHVSIGPIEPVIRPGDDPSDIPPEVYDARKIMVFNESGDILMEQVDIEHDGNYSVALTPGSYLVDINRLGIDYSSEVPRVIEIQAGETIHLDIDIDTGIRSPVGN